MTAPVSQAELDEHVHRILRTIFATGLFDHPVVRQVPDVAGGLAIAEKMADKSIVLLKNERHVLPLGPRSAPSSSSAAMPIKACSPAAAPRRSTRPAATLFLRLRPRPARCSSSARNGCPIRPSHAFKARFGDSKVSYVSGDDPPPPQQPPNPLTSPSSSATSGSPRAWT